jgi:hypothetical protein
LNDKRRVATLNQPPLESYASSRSTSHHLLLFPYLSISRMAGGSVSPKKKATTPASQEKKKVAAPKADGTGADIRNFVSPLLRSFSLLTV